MDQTIPLDRLDVLFERHDEFLLGLLAYIKSHGYTVAILENCSGYFAQYTYIVKSSKIGPRRTRSAYAFGVEYSDQYLMDGSMRVVKYINDPSELDDEAKTKLRKKALKLLAFD
jgi:hypothetical protein